MKSVLDAIGNTPLIEVEKSVFAKFEGLNPSGSIKDRAALEIINRAEREGILKPGYVVVEASSGNTGIALAMVCAVKGYKMVVTMPENMSEERKQIMKAYGAELILTSKKGSLDEAIAKAEEIAKKPNTFYARQFENPANVAAQEKTGEEIIKEIGAVDAVVAGVGTGGTLVGIANAVRKINPKVKVIAVEPEEAAVMFGGSREVKEHQIQGIGDGFIPKIVNMDEVDEAVTIKSQEAIDMAKKLAREKGLLVGISSGANVAVSIKIAEKYGRVATVMPDRGERYLSMNFFYE